MFGNNRREFVISLPKQAKCKSVFWEDCRLSLLPLGRPLCLRFEDSLPGVLCFIAFFKIWDCSTSGRELLNFKGHNQDVFTCMFSPDDSNVVSCSADKTVKVLLQYIYCTLTTSSTIMMLLIGVWHNLTPTSNVFKQLQDPCAGLPEVHFKFSFNLVG